MNTSHPDDPFPLTGSLKSFFFFSKKSFIVEKKSVCTIGKNFVIGSQSGHDGTVSIVCPDEKTDTIGNCRSDQGFTFVERIKYENRFRDIITIVIDDQFL